MGHSAISKDLSRDPSICCNGAEPLKPDLKVSAQLHSLLSFHPSLSMVAMPSWKTPFPSFSLLQSQPSPLCFSYSSWPIIIIMALDFSGLNANLRF